MSMLTFQCKIGNTIIAIGKHNNNELFLNMAKFSRGVYSVLLNIQDRYS